MVKISKVLQIIPMLGIAIIFMCVLYTRLLGTLKFTHEFYIPRGLLELSTTLTIFIFVIIIVSGLVVFSKCQFDIIFGMSLKGRK